MAISKLDELHTFMDTNSKKLRTPPTDLEHLSASIALLEDLQADLTNIEAKVPPLHEQFVILEKYEVEILEEVYCIFTTSIFSANDLSSGILTTSNDSKFFNVYVTTSSFE